MTQLLGAGEIRKTSSWGFCALVWFVFSTFFLLSLLMEILDDFKGTDSG